MAESLVSTPFKCRTRRNLLWKKYHIEQKAAIDEALKCKETGEEKTILFGLTGTGYFDMTAYSSYIEHTMGDYIQTDEELKKYANELPKV